MENCDFIPLWGIGQYVLMAIWTTYYGKAMLISSDTLTKSKLSGEIDNIEVNFWNHPDLYVKQKKHFKPLDFQIQKVVTEKKFQKMSTYVLLFLRFLIGPLFHNYLRKESSHISFRF